MQRRNGKAGMLVMVLLVLVVGGYFVYGFYDRHYGNGAAPAAAYQNNAVGATASGSAYSQAFRFSCQVTTLGAWLIS